MDIFDTHYIEVIIYHIKKKQGLEEGVQTLTHIEQIETWGEEMGKKEVSRNTWKGYGRRIEQHQQQAF